MTDSQPVDVPSRGSSRPRLHTDRAAARAASRFSRAAVILGALGLASFVFVVLRLLETWRVTPHVTHHVSVLGQTLSYPVANTAAALVLALAMVGLVVTARTVSGVARELAAARRFAHRLSAGAREHPSRAFVIDDERPHAFCAGLLRPRVYVTSGALAILDEPALEAVLIHERHHAQRRDPLRLATSRVLGRAMFFLPGLHELGRRQQALAELSADESAINAAPGNRSALARAMISFSDAAGPADSVGVDPARVDYLLGEAPSWRFPALFCLLGVALLALVVAVAVLAGQVASGSATLAPPFLSAQPCVVVLAMIPAGIALAAIRLERSRRLRAAAVAALSD